MDNVIHFNDWNNSYIPNILKEIYLDKVYEPYRKYIEGQVVLDMGCNIGLWSLYASKLASRVYSFEPAKATFDIATRNLTDNKAFTVALYQQAIAEKNGITTFYHNENTTMNSLNPAVGNKPELQEEVETVRIDTFLKDNKLDHIGFAKIDIEGTEDKFFVSESFQNIVPKLDAFVYEYHAWCQSNPQMINGALSDYGYKVVQIPSEALIFGAVKA